MDTEDYQPLLRMIDQQAGMALRTAFLYDDGEWSTLYMRDDVATGELADHIEIFIQRANEQEPIIQAEQYDKLKQTQATIELHEEGVLIHFREGPSRGVLVSLEREAARNLAEFIDQCNKILAET